MTQPAENTIPTPDEVVAARGKARLKQQECADLVRVDLRTWQRWEKGSRKISPGHWLLFRILVAHPELRDFE